MDSLETYTINNIEWRPVLGFENTHMVSANGDVYSKLCGRNLVPDITKEGYAQVFLNHGERNKERRLVHRIVAEAFLDNYTGLPVVHHKDSNRTNNCVSNLEWCSYEENNSKSNCYEKASTATSKAVYQYDENWNLVSSYGSVREACRITGYTIAVIARACNNPETIRYGFHWSYTKEGSNKAVLNRDDETQIYTTQDIQNIFKCGKKWAYDLMRSPGFPSVKIGGKYIVERRALETWLDTYCGKEFII